MRNRMMFASMLVVVAIVALMAFALRGVDAANAEAARLGTMRDLTDEMSQLNAGNAVALTGVLGIVLAPTPEDAAVAAEQVVSGNTAQVNHTASIEQLAVDLDSDEISAAVAALAEAQSRLAPLVAEINSVKGDPPLVLRAIGEPAVAEAAAESDAAKVALDSVIREQAVAVAAAEKAAAQRSKQAAWAGTAAVSLLLVLATWLVSNRVCRRLGVVVASLVGDAADLDGLGRQLNTVACSTSEESAAVAGAGAIIGNSVREVAASVQQLGGSIEEISRTASNANTVTTRAVAEASQTSETMARLGASSAEIGQVVQLIASVADQTNLLALNATIEAARAGESGRGFAVVASEVKELATQTSAATAEIATRINAIQADTDRAIEAIGRIAATVGDVSELQHSIAAAVEEQAFAVAQVAHSMTVASTSTTDIMTGIQAVADTSVTTKAAISGLLDAVEHLGTSTTELRTLAHH